MSPTLLVALVLAAAATAPTASAVVQLTSFDAITHALMSGHTLRAVAKYGQCKYPDGSKTPIAVGSSVIDDVEYFDDPGFGPNPFFAFSSSRLIENYQSPTGGYVFDWVRFTVEKSGAVNITARYLTTQAYNVTMDETFICSVNLGGASTGGVYFHDESVPSANPSPSVDQLLLFRTFIVGHFSNAAQVAAEKAAGNPVHPFAEHISDVANQKMVGLPTNFGGYFVLEESYYTNVTTGAMSPSPFLFLFSRTNAGSVLITAYNVPSSIPSSALRNNNTDLKLDYSSLTVSRSFNPSVYTFDATSQSFFLNSTTPLPGGGSFILTETIEVDRLRVLEQVVFNGVNNLPYSTPILYNRI